MGRNKRRGGRNGPGSRKPKDDEYRADLLDKSDMVNQRFETYYKAQRIIPEEEWDTFMEALKRHLPTTFRVAGSRQIAKSLNETIKNVHVPHLNDVSFEGEKIPPPTQLPWYPDGLAWQFNVPKKVLRKEPEFKKFHSFLVFETEVGNISRQEAVSMLPPLFLEVEPHHKVIDMCAAPGSKTAQLLEALHANDSVTSTSIPSGLLMANDSDNKRTHLLIHQSARLPSPAFMVTNLDASIYPIMKIPADLSSADTSHRRTRQLLFDRILCDVPCSGDGTLRKNLGIWKSWQPNDGNGLHGLQVRILQRAMKMLANKGRIVYSTCSLNPVENEAVIAEALRTNAEFQLVDVSNMLPELKRMPGVRSWHPSIDREVNTACASYQDFLASEQSKAPNKLSEGHWPPANVETYNLERCMRIYPHLQDTGGFFVAVLERRESTTEAAITKKREAEDVEEDSQPDAKKLRLEDETQMETEFSGVDDADILSPSVGDVAASGLETPMSEDQPKHQRREKKAKERDGGGSFKEAPYTFLPPDDSILRSCIERLSLGAAFPSGNMLVRNDTGEAVRSMYLANDLVKAVIQNNDYARIRLTSAGTKVFTKQDGGKGGESQFRVLGEGLPVILPFVDSEAIIDGDMSALKTLTESNYPLTEHMPENFKNIINSRSVGSHVVRFPAGEAVGGVLSHDVLLPIWKSPASLTLMMDKKAKSALSLRVFGQDITPVGKPAQLATVSSAATPTPNHNPADMEVFAESDLLH